MKAEKDKKKFNIDVGMEEIIVSVALWKDEGIDKMLNEFIRSIDRYFEGGITYKGEELGLLEKERK